MSNLQDLMDMYESVFEQIKNSKHVDESVHPFFGSVKNNITPEQAFRMGQNMVIKHSRKTKIDKINKSQ